MNTISDLLTHLAGQALEALFVARGLPRPADLRLEASTPTNDASHGDYQVNHAFRISKLLRQSPRMVADELVKLLPAHPAIARTEVAGPGFINIFLDDAWLAGHLDSQMADPCLGIPQEGAGLRVVIDYGSPNVAKRMHVGHLRSTVIGGALVGIHRALGYEVIGDNHIGDWGTHFGKLIVAWRLWGSAQALQDDPIGELQRIYVLFGREAEQAPDLEDQARHETAKLQRGDPDNRALWRTFVDASLLEFNHVYQRLGVVFDEILGESAYQDELQPLVEELLAQGHAIVDQGAVIFPFTDADGPNLSKSPMLVRKGDGAALYATTDLATIRYRTRRWNPDRMVYVTDTRQQLHFQQFFAAARRIGATTADLVHVWFGVLTLPEGAMSTRAGNVIRLEELLDEAGRRARAVVDVKSPMLSDEERASIAEAVGVAAVKYADLSQNPQSNIVFEWDRMLALEGNTAPLLLYSYARCRSIQRKAEAEVASGIRIGHPVERDLVMALARFPESVQAARNTSRPNLLCDHLYQLAGTFNRFYGELQVLKAEPAERASRLALVEAMARVLARGLEILGIKPLERM